MHRKELPPSRGVRALLSGSESDWFQEIKVRNRWRALRVSLGRRVSARDEKMFGRARPYWSATDLRTGVCDLWRLRPPSQGRWARWWVGHDPLPLSEGDWFGLFVTVFDRLFACCWRFTERSNDNKEGNAPACTVWYTHVRSPASFEKVGWPCRCVAIVFFARYRRILLRWILNSSGFGWQHQDEGQGYDLRLT